MARRATKKLSQNLLASIPIDIELRLHRAVYRKPERWLPYFVVGTDGGGAKLWKLDDLVDAFVVTHDREDLERLRTGMMAIVDRLDGNLSERGDAVE